MNLQYISGSNGDITGVFIPIEEWNDLKNKFKEIEQEITGIPEWHKDIVIKRHEDYNKDRGSAEDFDAAMDNIEKDL